MFLEPKQHNQIIVNIFDAQKVDKTRIRQIKEIIDVSYLHFII